MNAKRKVVAVILARGGSVGIPLKNIKVFLGKPLIAWAIQVCKDCKEIDEVWVSTDHDEIARIAGDHDALVHRRQPVGDAVSSIESIHEVLRSVQADILINVQCTSPCLHPVYIGRALDLLNKGYDSVFSVVRLHMFRWKECDLANLESTSPQNLRPSNRPRRQDWPGELYENGAFYLARTSILTSGMFQGGRVGYVEMPKEISYEIDYPEDWQIAESRMQKYGHLSSDCAHCYEQCNKNSS